MLLSLKIQFFFFSRSNHLPIASSQLLVIWLSWGSLNDTRGGKTRLEITGESKDRERRKEKGEEEGKRRRSRPKSERRENLARRSVGGRKEGSSGTRTADFYFCVSLIPLSFFRLFLGGSWPPPPSHFLYLRARGEGYRVLGTRLYRYRTPPRHDGGGIS